MSYYRARYKPLDQLVDLTDYQREPLPVSLNPELEKELERELQRELQASLGPTDSGSWVPAQSKEGVEPRLDAFGQRASSETLDVVESRSGEHPASPEPDKLFPGESRGAAIVSRTSEVEGLIKQGRTGGTQLTVGPMKRTLEESAGQLQGVATTAPGISSSTRAEHRSSTAVQGPVHGEPQPRTHHNPVFSALESSPTVESGTAAPTSAGRAWMQGPPFEAAVLGMPSSQEAFSSAPTPSSMSIVSPGPTPSYTPIPTPSAVLNPPHASSSAGVRSPGLRVRGEGAGEHRRRGSRSHAAGAAALDMDREMMERLRHDDGEEKGFRNQPLPAVLVRVIRLWWQEQDWPADVRTMSKAQMATLSTFLMAFLLLFIALMLLAASAHRRTSTLPADSGLPVEDTGGASELMAEGVGKRDSLASWLSAHLHRQRGKASLPNALVPPPPDWLLHKFTDLQRIANGTALAPRSRGSLQALPHPQPSTCWSILERHHLYPRATPASSSSSPGSAFQQGASGVNVPPPALLDGLRKYEQMHKRCVEEVDDWSKHTEQLEEGRQDCKYVVWVEPGGNATVATRLLSLVSVFVYGLVTDRALLVHSSRELETLLCQPFPHSSWWAPPGMLPDSFSFAPRQGEWVNGSTGHQREQDTKRRDVVMVQLKMTKYVWDLQFFCDSMQTMLGEQAAWVLFNTDQYLAPGLFLVDQFRPVLSRLFPSRVVLQPLVRYLLHPTNAVWDRVTRVYEGYLYPANYRVGVEVDVLGSGAVDEKVNERVVQCGTRHGLFPHPITSDQWATFLNSSASAMRQQSSSLLGEIDAREAQLEDAFEREMRIRRGRRRQKWSQEGNTGGAAHSSTDSKGRRLRGTRGRVSGGSSVGARPEGFGLRHPMARKEGRSLLGRMRKVLSVFVCSSTLAPYVHLKRVFSERPMEDHSLVTVHSESVEESEESRVLSPQQKTMAELWILSMADALLLSYMSNAGYLAAGLAGKVPLLMNVVDWEEQQESEGGMLSVHNSWRTNEKPVCERAWASEGCFLAPPESLTCSSDPRGDGSNGTQRYRQSPDTFQWLPFVRACQDYDKGLTIVPKFRFPSS